jgi:hypothetical protein
LLKIKQPNMPFTKKIAAIRQKPRHVRERYLFAAMVIFAPVLVVVWLMTFHYDASSSGTGFIKSIGSTVSGSFSSPVYKDTFGGTSFMQAPAPAPTTTP